MSEVLKIEKQLDLKDLLCPIPVVKLSNAIKAIQFSRLPMPRAAESSRTDFLFAGA